jgi:hypothetical protein
MAAVLLSNPGLPLAVLGNPGRSRRSLKMKRSVRFFLRRFKRNPHYNVTTQTAGGALKQDRTFSRNEASLRAKLASAGLDVISVSKAAGAPRKKHRKTAVATKSRKHHMARKTKRRSKRRTSHRLHLSAYGRVYRKKIGKHMHSVRIIGSRKARAGKKKVRRAAVKWSGRRGTVSIKGLAFGSAKKRGTHKVYFTNPKRRKSRRARRNPVGALAGDFVGGLTSFPRKAMGLFKGPNMIKNVAFTAGGAVGTFMIGGVLSAKVIRPLLEKVAPGFAAKVADPSSIQARIVGGILPYAAAFAITKLFGKKLGSDISTALLLGGAAASVVELIKPGMVGDLLKKVGLGEIPTVGPALAGLGALNGPIAGLGYGDALAGYVEAPAYAGTAGYVEAPAYAGTAGYVEAPAYAGTGGADELAGTFLEDASSKILENNWLS